MCEGLETVSHDFSLGVIKQVWNIYSMSHPWWKEGFPHYYCLSRFLELVSIPCVRIHVSRTRSPSTPTSKSKFFGQIYTYALATSAEAWDQYSFQFGQPEWKLPQFLVGYVSAAVNLVGTMLGMATSLKTWICHYLRDKIGMSNAMWDKLWAIFRCNPTATVTVIQVTAVGASSPHSSTSPPQPQQNFHAVFFRALK